MQEEEQNQENPALLLPMPAGALACLSAAQKVLTNSMLLPKILREIPSWRQVLNLRLVNRLWAFEGSRVLRQPPQNRQILVSFVALKPTARYTHSNRVSRGSLHYFHQNVFNAHVPISWTFPCSHFSFSGGNLGNPDAQSFFLDPKGQEVIRGLKLTISDDRSTTTVTLKQVLFDWLPNLTTLKLTTCPWTIEMSENDLARIGEEEQLIGQTYGSGKILPSLKYIYLPPYKGEKYKSYRLFSPVVAEILTAAVNLVAFYSPPPDINQKLRLKLNVNVSWIREIAAARQIQRFTAFCYSYEYNHQHHLQLFSRLSDSLQLTLFSMETERQMSSYPVEMEAIKAILEGNQNSLQEIRGINNIAYLYKFTGGFPVFNQVNSISFYTEYHESSSKFEIVPPGVDLQDIFPNLKVLDFSFTYKHQRFLCAKTVGWNYHPLAQESNAHSTLEVLKLSTLFLNYFPPFALKSAGRLYPNLKELELEIEMKGKSFPTTCELIWTSFTNLEKLTITPIWPRNKYKDKVNDPNHGNPIPPAPVIEECDSAITGIEAKICKELRENPQQNVDFQPQFERIQQDANNVSIRNLRRLKELHVNGSKTPIFSDVSLNYGFQPMNLRVTVNKRLITITG